VAASPNSRFLFAYSGHGFTDGDSSYFLQADATSMKDQENSIDTQVIRQYIKHVVKRGHQVLVLLNACYAGSFLERSFGSDNLPHEASEPGAYAVAAGGPSELTWHIDEVGPGSVFFEKVLAGLDGSADYHHDGVITIDELVSYLRTEVTLATSGKQTPRVGDISLNGSQGSFYFLNRSHHVTVAKVSGWNGGQAAGPNVLLSESTSKGQILQQDINNQRGTDVHLAALQNATLDEVIDHDAALSELRMQDPDEKKLNWTTLIQSHGQIYAAARTYGSGRVIVLGHTGGLNYRTSQNEEIIHHMFEWLNARQRGRVVDLSIAHCDNLVALMQKHEVSMLGIYAGF